MPPEPIMPTRRDVGTRQQARADARRRAHPHVLQMAVIEDRQRFAIVGAEQQHQAAIGAGLHAIFLLRPAAVRVLRPGHDVGFQPHRMHAIGGAFDRAEAVIAVLAFAGHKGVDARPRHRGAGQHAGEGALLHGDAVFRGQDGGDHVVVDQQHQRVLSRAGQTAAARARPARPGCRCRRTGAMQSRRRHRASDRSPGNRAPSGEAPRR